MTRHEVALLFAWVWMIHAEQLRGSDERLRQGLRILLLLGALVVFVYTLVADTRA